MDSYRLKSKSKENVLAKLKQDNLELAKELIELNKVMLQ